MGGKTTLSHFWNMSLGTLTFIILLVSPSWCGVRYRMWCVAACFASSTAHLAPKQKIQNILSYPYCYFDHLVFENCLKIGWVTCFHQCEGFLGSFPLSQAVARGGWIALLFTLLISERLRDRETDIEYALEMRNDDREDLLSRLGTDYGLRSHT